jgi:hypothetical protein
MAANLVPLPPLTEFRAWLLPQPWRRVIGRRVDCGGCPLATWLTTLTGLAALVDEETVCLGEQGAWNTEEDYDVFPTPPDYRAFIERIDYGGEGTREVMVEEAVRVVTEIMKDADA